jgi:hypothetical protein
LIWRPPDRLSKGTARVRGCAVDGVLRVLQLRAEPSKTPGICAVPCAALSPDVKRGRGCSSPRWR